MKLVICEKNIAARRIAYFLSGGSAKSSRLGAIPIYQFSKQDEPWTVIGLKGHIVSLDYPAGYNQWNKIHPRELITVDPQKIVHEKRIASALKTLVDKNPFVIVATDYDREGELIGVEAVDVLKGFNGGLVDIKRAKFSAITGHEIDEAFSKLSNVDYHLASAGEARQIIDLVWGAVLTRFISLTSRQLGKDFLSIGRVQSPTLALLVEREKEIQSFESKPYWKLIAHLKKQQEFTADHVAGQIWDEQQAKTLYDKVKDARQARVSEVETKQQKEYPPPPLNTTMLLQAASYMGLSAAKAMSIAEELYMTGLISYPRTDNTVYPKTLSIRNILAKLGSTSQFKDDVDFVHAHKRPYPTRGKKQTTDHPPIHPVDVPKNRKMSKEQHTMYEFICRRFLATLCQDAESEIMEVKFDINSELFQAKGYRLLKPTWKKVYPYIKEKRTPLPGLSKDEQLPVERMEKKKDKTKPPKRYTQGSLIAKMEQLSLGTKSTRHEIISKLYGRRYIVGQTLKPSATAIAVVDALEDCDVVKPKMTARLEEDMDQIADGKKTLEEIVKESRDMLAEVMVELEKDKEKIKDNITSAVKKQNFVGKCPNCGKDLVVRMSKKRKRFVGCSGYPDCTTTYPLPQRGAVIPTEKQCNTCKAPVVRIKERGKRGWEMCLNINCSSKNNKK